MDKVVHFEIPVDNLSRAKSFYGAVFGWQLQDWPMPNGVYTGIRTVAIDEQTRIPKEPGAINGGMMQRSQEVATPIITINVDSIDACLKQIEKAGGKAVTPKGEVPQMGYYAYFKDSEGNVVGLWESIRR